MSEDLPTTGDTSTCAAVREAISARLDREEPAADAPPVAEHVSTCDSCRDHQRLVEHLHRRVRVAPSPHVPDLRARIVAAAETASPAPEAAVEAAASRRRDARVVLGLAGLVQVAVAIVGVLGAAPLHAVREVAALEVALGVAMVVAAWRPRRFTHGMLPLVALAAAILLVSAAIDILGGVARPVAEFSHLVPAIGAIVLWWLDRRPAGPALLAPPDLA